MQEDTRRTSMPYKANRPCKEPGCTAAAADGRIYCREHERQYDRRRDAGVERKLYGSKWTKARRQYLMQHPLCVECQRDGVVEAATVVDHIEPHRGDYMKFWNRANWQGLCKRHHDSKTATEDAMIAGRR